MRLHLLPPSSSPRHARRILAKLGASAALTAATAAILLSGTASSFNDVTSNPANGGFSAGTVSISDNDGGLTQFAMPNAEPGDAVSGCVVVTYNGSVPATVVMYGNPGGTLGPYLNLKVTRGTIPGTPAPGSCTNFTADTTNYIGQGAGVMYSATVGGWPASSGTGLADPLAGSLETWTPGEAHAYLISITLQNTLAAQGKTATQTFVWEAANT